MKTVYPVPDVFVPGEPAVVRTVTDAKARWLVWLGAFTTDPPPKEAEPTQPEDPAGTPGLLISEE